MVLIDKQIIIVSFVLVTIIAVSFFSSSSSSLPQQVQACKLESELTLDMGFDNVTIKDGVVSGYHPDFEYESVRCHSVGEALDSGYTLDEINMDLLRSLPL